MARRVRGKVVVFVVLGLIGLGLTGAFLAWFLAGEQDARTRVAVEVDAPELGIEALDESVAVPLARALAGIEPGTRVETVTRDGRTTAVLELTRGEGDPLDRVRAAVRTLPAAGAVPAIVRVPRARPVRWIVTGEDPGARQRELAARVERISGVLAVRSCRVPEREVHVVIDQARASAMSVTATGVADAIRASNTDIPGGRLVAGGSNVLVRAVGRIGSAEEIASLRIRDQVRASDVASVAEAFAEGGCRCVAADAACATGAASVFDIGAFGAVIDALRAEPGVSLVDGEDAESIPMRVAVGATLEERARLGRHLAQEAAGGGPTVTVAVEVDPAPSLDSPDADLRLLIAPAPAGSRRGDGHDEQPIRQVILRTPGVLIAGVDGPSRVAVLEGESLETLMDAAQPIAQALRNERVVRTVVVDGIELGPELRVEVDRSRAGEVGVGAEEIARAVRMAQHGEVVADLREGAELVPVRVLAGPRRELGPFDATAIGRITMPTPRGAVPLDALVRFEQVTRPREMRRCGERRCVRIVVAVAPGEARSLDAISRSVMERELPRGVTLRWDDELPLFPM